MDCSNKRTWDSNNKISFFIAALLVFPMQASAVVCPSPVVVANSDCEVAPGTAITVTTSNTTGLDASGSLGEIIANGIIENLGAATTTGARAQSGSRISFNGSTLRTTATTTAAAAGQIGLYATGGSSAISATGSSITLGPANGTTTANNLTGARAENGGQITFTDTVINILGGAAGLRNIGITATGINSKVNILRGSISTISRAHLAC